MSREMGMHAGSAAEAWLDFRCPLQAKVWPVHHTHLILLLPAPSVSHRPLPGTPRQALPARLPAGHRALRAVGGPGPAQQRVPASQGAAQRCAVGRCACLVGFKAVREGGRGHRHCRRSTARRQDSTSCRLAMTGSSHPSLLPACYPQRYGSSSLTLTSGWRCSWWARPSHTHDTCAATAARMAQASVQTEDVLWLHSWCGGCCRSICTTAAGLATAAGIADVVVAAVPAPLQHQQQRQQ